MDTKRGLYLSFIAALIFLVMPFASAEILGGQTNLLYNVGDSFNVTVTLLPSRDSTSFFSSKLVCDDGAVEIHRNFYTLKTGERKDITIYGRFDDFLLGDMREGTCYIDFTYDNEQTQTRHFQITQKVNVALDIEGVAFDPGAQVVVSGTAKKANTQPLDGFVTVKIPELNITVVNPVKSGAFGFNLTLPTNALPEDYEVTARVYEKDSNGEILNEGSTAEVIKIKQLVKGIHIDLDSQSIKPGTDLLYTVYLVDQAGQQIAEDVGITYSTPSREVFDKRLVRTSSQVSFPTKTTTAPGDWKVQAKIGDLVTEKEFYIAELMSAEFRIENGTLIVVNTGNVPYKRPVQISIGDVTEIQDISLGVGENQRTKLIANTPGTYNVAVGDGEKNQSFEGIPLAGRPPSITASVIGGGEAVKALKSNFLLWILIFVLLVLAGIALFFYRRHAKKNVMMGNAPPMKTYSPTKIAGSPSRNIPPSKKGSSVIHQGKKEEAVLVSLYIRNMADLQKTPGSPTLEAVQKANYIAKEAKAKVYADGDYRLMVFSPSTTGEVDNLTKAIRAAQEIESIYQESNKKFVQKINFGIGINYGDIAVDQSEGKFKFTPLGNSVGTAKRIANYSRSDVLISEAMRRKVSGKVKVDKIGDMNIWKIKKLASSPAHEQFINQFMNRQKNDVDPRFSKSTSTSGSKPSGPGPTGPKI